MEEVKRSEELDTKIVQLSDDIKNENDKKRKEIR
jgi:hypothetical protein